MEEIKKTNNIILYEICDERTLITYNDLGILSYIEILDDLSINILEQIELGPLCQILKVPNTNIY